MRLLPCHSGHRFRLPSWNNWQFVDIKLVARSHMVCVDENGKEQIVDRNDMVTDWIHMGATPRDHFKRHKGKA